MNDKHLYIPYGLIIEKQWWDGCGPKQKPQFVIGGLISLGLATVIFLLCVYEYVRNTADEVDKKTAVMFCDYVIDILCKNIESNMQLNFAEDYRFCLIYEIAKFKYGLEHE